jgi:hypothetical protein
VNLRGRQIEVEWLDALPPAHPGAIHSRRDLQKLNVLMGNAGIVAHALREAPYVKRPQRLVELGAGDGTFLLSVARRLAPEWHGIQAVVIDRLHLLAPRTRIGFEGLGWTVRVIEADLFDWLKQERDEDREPEVIISNLLLHHFTNPQLRLLLRLVGARAQCLVACEPERNRLAFAAARLSWLIGCGRVTLHDAPVSVRAGFRGQELSDLWCPESSGWVLSEGRAGLFSHRFQACRIHLDARWLP